MIGVEHIAKSHDVELTKEEKIYKFLQKSN